MPVAPPHHGHHTSGQVAPLRRILLQEGRHLRFFTRAAKIVLASSPATAAAVRRVTELTWRPPGVDLYAVESWTKMFAPVLSDTQTMDEMAGVDAKLGLIPGFEGSNIVGRYLERFAARFRSTPV